MLKADIKFYQAALRSIEILLMEQADPNVNLVTDKFLSKENFNQLGLWNLWSVVSILKEHKKPFTTRSNAYPQKTL